jgi:hypothetical protein
MTVLDILFTGGARWFCRSPWNLVFFLGIVILWLIFDFDTIWFRKFSVKLAFPTLLLLAFLVLENCLEKC